MKSDREAVRAFYNEHAEGEWNRIGGRPEFLLTCRFFDKLIPEGSRVADIGGGPGRYSLHLARRGCRVTLCDLSEENVRLAKERAEEEKLCITAVAGDALETKTLPGAPFDAVLLMGPLYHWESPWAEGVLPEGHGPWGMAPLSLADRHLGVVTGLASHPTV